jgi:hypothetical protein
MKLDYDTMIHLDAENLAEAGIGAAYRELLPELGKHVSNTAEVLEVINNDLPSYSVRCNGSEFVVYSGGIEIGEASSWIRATFAFFSIVNAQLVDSEIRLYALNYDNDLSGMFLTPEQAVASRDFLKRKNDWPYIPDLIGPWFGRHH